MKHFKQFLLLLVLAVFSTSGAWATEYNMATLGSDADLNLVDGDVLYGTASKAPRIYIADGATITLRNAILNFMSLGGPENQPVLYGHGSCTIILEGTNYLEPSKSSAISAGGILTIKGDGRLEAHGNQSPGIDNNESVNIYSGNIYCYASSDYPGIECHYYNENEQPTIDKRTLNIYGGYVEAHGGDYAAGIGSQTSWINRCGIVNIYGGVVKAYGGSDAPGIGSGQRYYEQGKVEHTAEGGIINIYGGDVEAYGGQLGAGIGGGDGGKGGTITISGGEVKAYGGVDGAGIGGGEGGEGGTITISGGTVYAYGNYKSDGEGAGIGGGEDGAGVTINISGGYVEAYGGKYGAGIGGGDGGDGGQITISGGEVKAYGGVDGAGIGGGEGGDAGTITISGGTVYAESTGAESYGSGIGAGEDGDCSKVNISGGVIHAKGGELGHAIGTNNSTAVHFADDLVAWTEDGNISSAATRSSFSCSNRDVHINICDHNGATFTDISNATHTVTSCPHCALTNVIEHHFAGADGNCTQCHGQVFAGSGTSGEPFLLTNATYPSFARGIQYVNDFSGKHFQMTENIATDMMANGTFSGTLNGDKHTVTLTLGSGDNYLRQSCAMFNTLNGATIMNLRIAGSIYSSAQYNASMARFATGKNTIQGCVSSVSINSNITGDCSNGGFIGTMNEDGSILAFEGCAFTGQLIGANANNWGGFIGWREYLSIALQLQFDIKCYANFTDCLFAPTQLNVDTSTGNSRTFCRSRSNTTDGATYTRCYYIKVLQEADGGTDCISTSILPDDIGTAGTDYGIIKAYTNGLKCDDLYYVHSDHFSVPTNAVTGTFAGNWCTYYNSSSNLQGDNNTTIYTINETSGTTATLHEVSGKIIKAGQGVILKSTGNITLTYTSTAATDADYTGNLLAGVDVQTTISGSAYADKVIYTLSKVGDDFGFFKYYAIGDYTDNTTLGANKAFLPLDAAASARSFVFKLEDATGVNEELRMKNEEWAGAQWYTIDGRKLSGKPSAKGVYIYNGKKIIVR